MQLFKEVYKEVATRYVDDIDPKEFMRAGIRGMLGTLDPYSVFIDEADADDLQIMTTGKYGGVGIVIGLKGESKVLTVISPMEGTPAARLGIRAGDEIIEIDGVSTEGFDTNRAASMMRGEAGTTVKIKIRRMGIADVMEYEIVREEIIVSDVSHFQMIDDETGYIRLARFSRKAGGELDSALKSLKAQGMKSLILDLRGNPGGLLEAAVEVTERFIPAGKTIVSTRGMIPEANRVINSRGSDLCSDCALAVLTDGGSASASEIVAGAVQDHDRGLIIGENTFGKGLVQSLVNLPYGVELKLTTAKYYTPSGRLIQKADYFGKDNPVIMEKADKSEQESGGDRYFTANGREVLGGGGISPDIKVETEETTLIIAAMYQQSKFFNFANEYCSKGTAAEALADSELMNKYEAYLKEVNFDYEADGQKELDYLKTIGAKQGLSEDYAELILKIEGMINSVKQSDLAKNRGAIERYLRMEFASRGSGTKGRFEESLPQDAQLLKAMEALKSKDRYGKILAGKEL